MLNGNKERPSEKEKSGRKEEDNDDTEEEQVIRNIKRLRKKKATGGNNIKNEAWIYGTNNLVKRVTEIMNKIWKGEGLPERWRKGIISPIHKTGDKDDVKNYRGITLLDTLYKLYAMILEEKLRNEAEQKGLIPDYQAGYRRGRGAMDNIYIMNIFVDLKAAFDMVDRKELVKTLEKMGICARLVQRIGEIYERTGNVVKVGEIQSEEFWTIQGVRQGCPLSPILFTLYTADRRIPTWRTAGRCSCGLCLWRMLTTLCSWQKKKKT